MTGLTVRHTSNYNLIYKPFKFYHYGNYFNLEKLRSN